LSSASKWVIRTQLLTRGRMSMRCRRTAVPVAAIWRNTFPCSSWLRWRHAAHMRARAPAAGGAKEADAWPRPDLSLLPGGSFGPSAELHPNFNQQDQASPQEAEPASPRTTGRAHTTPVAGRGIPNLVILRWSPSWWGLFRQRVRGCRQCPAWSTSVPAMYT